MLLIIYSVIIPQVIPRGRAPFGQHQESRPLARAPFLEAPGNLTGPESDFDIKVLRKVGPVLTSDEVHIVSLADNFTVQFSNLLKLPLQWKTKQLNGPGNYRELRETGPRSDDIPTLNGFGNNRLTPEPITFVRLDSEHVQ